MIRYLAYYSLGGYKDMLVGSNENKAEMLYYSPFLKPWLEGSLTNIDERTCKQLQLLKDLPHIEVLTRSSTYQMPVIARSLVAHSGYRMAYCQLNDGTYSIAVRDIHCNTNDEFGRPAPFMMQFVSEKVEESDALASYFRCHLDEVRKRLSELFSYNPQLNCLQFNLAAANLLTKESLEHSPDIIPNASNHTIRQIIVTSGVPILYCISELGFSMSDVGVVYSEEGRIVFDGGNTVLASDEGSVLSGDGLTNKSDSSLFMGFLAWLKKCTTLSPEDKADINSIRQHIIKIIKRHKLKL